MTPPAMMFAVVVAVMFHSVPVAPIKLSVEEATGKIVKLAPIFADAPNGRTNKNNTAAV